MTAEIRTVVLVALLAGGVWLYGRARFDAGKDAAALTQIAARVETLTVNVHTRDTIAKRVVRETEKILTQYDTVRVTDTVMVNNVVYVPRAIADTAVSMCRQAIVSLRNSCAAKDTLIAALRLNVQAEAAKHPSFIETWAWRLGALGVGYTLGKAK